jgi:hypothetical protein
MNKLTIHRESVIETAVNTNSVKYLIEDGYFDLKSHPKNEYHRALEKLIFQYACFFELDVEPSAAAEKAWELACSNGHDLMAVYDWMEELAEILKAINEEFIRVN